MTIEPIATIHTNLSGKFGVPRQSGVVPELAGVIEFEPAYRNADALRGLDGFSHIWLVWGFSESAKEERHGFFGDASYSPTVRPPRLGGNKRLGVFATRSPFRPNDLGLSVVRLRKIDEGSMTLFVSGVDLMDGTPIYDIKPYIPYSDAVPQASAGFTGSASDLRLRLGNPEVLHEQALAAGLDEEMEAELTGILRNDPRPQYQEDPDRVYGLTYGGHDVRFRISEDDVLTLLEIE